MSVLAKLDWNQLLGLHVVRKVAKLAERRWKLGFGYVDAARELVVPPKLSQQTVGRGPCQVLHESSEGRRHCAEHASKILAHFRDQAPLSAHASTVSCHADLTEVAAPILVNGTFVGALLCGGYLLEEQDETGLDLEVDHLPRLSQREVSFVQDLVEEAAAEIAEFLASEGALDNEGVLRDRYGDIIGASAAMQVVYGLIDRVIYSDSTVLITGENGTGKELVAKAIHYGSARHSERFVVQNCSAFNDNLLDSELFGHKRGAFTGAVSDKKGLFEVADKGTFFLDEIGDMSPSLQVKVLRVLQEGTFTPVGDTNTRHVDVRIVAATNRNLKAMVEDGSFREDLYYRINVINLGLPALRERIDDLEILVAHFLIKHEGIGKRLSPECLEIMRGYRWPGNVRELENEIERLVVLSGDSPILAAGLLSDRLRASAVQQAAPDEPSPISGSLPEAVKDLERRMIRQALVEHDWNKTRAAAQLQVSRRNLIRLVQKYELDQERDASARV